MFQIHCLMVKGGMLDDIMRTKLYQVARDLIKSQENNRNFRTSYMEGSVRTDYKCGMLGGSIFGIMCEAEFDCDKSPARQTVRYIVSQPLLEDDVIEEYQWTEMKDFLKEIEEKYGDHPSFVNSRNAHNN